MEKNIMNGKALWNAKGGKRVHKPKPARPASQSEAGAVRSQAAQRDFMITGAIVAMVLIIGTMVSPLLAQIYPTKPIRFVVPGPPGGGVDVVGRIVALKLAERLGQPVVCENRAGAAGNLGIEFVAKARPDGYTILITTPALAISPSLYKKLGYDPIKDFAPISQVTEGTQVMLIRPALPIKNLKEFVEYVRANPRKLNYGSGGVGTMGHLGSTLLNSLAKIDMVHVPYKGASAAMMGMIAGEVDMVVMSPPAAVPQIEAGKVRALAVLSRERHRLLPEVPTTKEAGIDNCEVTMWYGILAPAGTPRDIVNRLNAEWIKVAAIPDTKEKIQNAGFEPISNTPEQFAEFIKAETERWARVIKEANIQLID